VNCNSSIRLQMRRAQVLAHRGLRDVEKFSPAEMDEIRAAAAAQKQHSDAEVQKWGVVGKLTRFALWQVGQRLVTAPLLLIPGERLFTSEAQSHLDLRLSCLRSMTSVTSVAMASYPAKASRVQVSASLRTCTPTHWTKVRNTGGLL